MSKRPQSFVSGKNATGAQKPKDLMSKPKEAVLPAETKCSSNMGKPGRASNVNSINSNNRGKQSSY